MSFALIYLEALKAARKAEAAFFAEHGEPYFCGFAWIEFSSARTKWVTFCKKNSIGRKSSTKGWYIWEPTDNPTQSMEIKMAGAKAFASVLQKHDIECRAVCRPD